MDTHSRTFEDKPAIRTGTQILIGLAGCSGSGKTTSALRLATGIQKVCGGEIFVIDTEAKRALHYADQFKFRHVEFGAPFGPMDYLAAIEHCVKKGAKIIVVDSASHEHEGPGGVLEMHETEQKRLAEAWKTSMDKVNMSAWQKPKSERRRLLNSILQMPVNFIFCFRAKEKIDLKGARPLALGWMPIAGEEFVYEMTVNILLYPNGGGIPVWNPNESGEKSMIKLPGQFRQIFSQSQPVSEDIGEALAKWAAGSPVKVAVPVSSEKKEISEWLSEMCNKVVPHMKNKWQKILREQGFEETLELKNLSGDSLLTLHSVIGKEYQEWKAVESKIELTTNA